MASAVESSAGHWSESPRTARQMSARASVLRHQDEDVEKEPEQRGVPEEAPIAEQERLTKNDGNDPDVNRISHVAIETRDHQLLCRRDRGGVPSPCSAKRANESTSPGTPAMIDISPMARVSSKPKKAGRNSQSVIDHGTNPASTKGATTKKSAEPRTAIVLHGHP